MVESMHWKGRIKDKSRKKKMIKAVDSESRRKYRKFTKKENLKSKNIKK